MPQVNDVNRHGNASSQLDLLQLLEEAQLLKEAQDVYDKATMLTSEFVWSNQTMLTILNAWLDATNVNDTVHVGDIEDLILEMLED